MNVMGASHTVDCMQWRPGDGALVPCNEAYTHGPLPMLQRVLKRQGKLFQRDPTLTRARLVQCVIIGLLIGGLWFDLQVSAQNARCGRHCVRLRLHVQPVPATL